MTNTTEQEKLLITKYDLLFESRLSKTEESLKNLDKTLDRLDHTVTEGFQEIRADMKWLFGIMLGFSGILMGLMAKGFHLFV